MPDLWDGGLGNRLASAGLRIMLRAMKNRLLRGLLAVVSAEVVLLGGTWLLGSIFQQVLPPRPFNRFPAWALAIAQCFPMLAAIGVYGLWFPRGFRTMAALTAVWVLFLLGVTVGNSYLTYRNVSPAHVIEFLVLAVPTAAGGFLATYLYFRKAKRAGG